ncbi:TPA: hypothetical protein QDZ75_003691 [Stenotrophomonas maltophilia]|uniref:hypothetical protein n=1 Tax=Stenotrophomonas geniculata TaxID=86188 RepID=UPI0018D31FF4|nr:hypothetical protein [Stenotrophomonas maltophilia]HDS1139620.1 hypothetical protein [Stenotrophomonas maltophilia]
MAAPTLQIPQDVIEPIIQANITAAIAQALGGSANVLEKAVSTILATQVDSEGKPSNYHHSSHKTWLDWAIGDAIRKAARAAIEEQIGTLQVALKEQMVAQLTKKNSPLIKQIAEGLAAGAFSPEAIKWRLTISPESRD